MTDERKIALEDRAAAGGRMFSPSAARNRDFIADVFLAHMARAGAILEIGSGTGEHAVHIARKAPGLRWTPSDPDAASRASIAAWTLHEGLTNVDAPRAIDVTQEGWRDAVEGPLAGIVSINMIHIAPFEAAKGLFAGAGALLENGGKLFLYGPFSRHGAHTAPSNAAFDESLKARNPKWGVRDLEGDILPLAEKAGLKLEAVVPMPANNLSVVFAKL